jgi:HSP20 family protein
MALMKWDPMRELEDMSTRLNRLFRTDMGFARPEFGEGPISAAEWSPAVDVVELPDEYLIKAELPGVPKDQMKIDLKNGVLTVSGERKEEKEEKGKRFHRVERSYGSFLRSFTLPSEVDEQRISADHKEGVLSIHLPKSATAKPRAVDIRVN